MSESQATPTPLIGWDLSTPTQKTAEPAPMEQQRQALTANRVKRATALAQLASGEITTQELLRRACAEPELLKIRIHAIGSCLGDKPRATDRQLARVKKIVPGVERVANVGWLLDRRSGGRRFLAWLDAKTGNAPAWDGYPYRSNPTTGPNR